MRFAISLPQFYSDGSFDPAAFRAYLRRAEELGFESAWAAEQIIGTMPELGPIETMTFAAACSERIRLGCAMFVLPLYSPLHLAKSLASLDQLSRGRVEVGVALGGRTRPFSAFGITAEGLAARFTESLKIMELVWTQSRADFEGRFWQLKGVAMEPKPFQKPHPPIWIGGAHPSALRRAVRIGDGFFGAGSQSTAQFAEQMKVVREALAGSGREDAGFRIAKRAYIAVESDGDRARSRLVEGLNRLYGYFGLKGVEAFAVAGTADDCVRQLREIEDAGAGMILLNPVYDDAEQMERLASEVVPAFASRIRS